MGSIDNRQYDVVVFGATGFTGKFCAEHITKHAPTDLKWAIAGRNSKKLSAIAEGLKELSGDRKQPGIEIADLNSQDLDRLARKTKVLITSVGPFHMYGAPVVEACCKAGTHYVDCTGETPWIYEMQKKYDAQAKRSGALIMPQCGFESAPADLVAYSLVRFVRERLSTGVREVVHSINDIAGGVSGGTILSAMTLMDTYSLAHLGKTLKPYALCDDDARPPTKHPRPLAQRLLGSFYAPGLGLMTDSLCGVQDVQIVYRTWGLLDRGAYYGPRFAYSAWMRTANRVTGLLFHYTLAFAMLSLAFPPLRWLVRRLAIAPGEGPSTENQKHHFVKLRAIGTADSSTPRRAVCNLDFRGDMYHLTGVLMAEAAMVLLRPRQDNWARKLGSGFVTPACLGDEYIERLAKAGLSIDVAFEN